MKSVKNLIPLCAALLVLVQLLSSASFGQAESRCSSDERYRQFDFWLGEWEVKDAEGKLAGESSITSDLSGCVVFEHYRTPTYSGKSINIFDVTDGKWHQTWVDVTGVLTEYTGGIEDGKMIYVADEVRNGNPVLLKMTFTKKEDGSVRQFGEFSSDKGKTWKVRYDLLYLKKK